MSRIWVKKEGRGWKTYPAVHFEFKAGARDWIDRAGRKFRDSARDLAPKRSGRLAASLHFLRTVNSPNFVRGELSGVVYAEYIAFGRATPWVIEAKAAKALHWRDRPMPGQKYFARRVTHPPYAGDRFPQRALEAVREEITKDFQDIMQERLRRALEK